VKLFQIEEPDGGPADAGAPGAAIGIDACGPHVEVAFAVGGNAILLNDREGFEQALRVPGASAGAAAWQEMFEGARIRAERALARPVTGAVIVLAATPGMEAAEVIREAARRAGLGVLRLVVKQEQPAGLSPALTAAMLAEDLAPRPELDPSGPG